MQGLFALALPLLLAGQARAQVPAISTLGLTSDVRGNGGLTKLELNKQFYFEFKDPIGVYGSIKDVILYVNGSPLPQCPAVGIDQNRKHIFFQLTLNRPGNTAKTIVDLVRKDFGNYDNIVSLQLGVGLANGTNVSTYATPIELEFFNPLVVTFTAIGAVLLLVISIIWLYRHHGLDDSGAAAGAKPTKSLSKFQLLLWTLAIAFVYFSLWLILHEAPTLPASLLGLLLISVGATGASAVIPTRKTNTTGLSSMLANDQGDTSVARLQYLVFTFIFLVLFIYTAIAELRVYDFQPQQLALMGVSAGGYLGLKSLKAG